MGFRRREHLIDLIFVVTTVFIYYVIPKSLHLSFSMSHKLIGEELWLWHKERVILVALCLVYLTVMLGMSKFSRGEAITIICAIAFMGYNFLLGRFAVLWGLSGTLAAVILFKRLRTISPTSLRTLGKFTAVCCFLYVLQYTLFSLDGRNVASFLDANISGYYLFLACVLFRARRWHIAYVLGLVFGFLSLSRNFMLAILVFEGFLLLSRSMSRIRFLPKAPVLILTLFSLIAITALSYWFVNAPLQVSANSGGVGRIMTLADQSNEGRFQANLHFFRELSDGGMIVEGHGDNNVNTQYHRPHNAFFRSVYRYGLIYALALIFLFVRIGNWCYRFSPMNRAFIVALFCYYSFLSDFITGPELVLFVVFNVLVNHAVTQPERHRMRWRSLLRGGHTIPRAPNRHAGRDYVGDDGRVPE